MSKRSQHPAFTADLMTLPGTRIMVVELSVELDPKNRHRTDDDL